MTNPSDKTDDKQTFFLIPFLSIVAVAAFLALIAKFGSTTPAELGQLGDFIGGLMNPLVATFAAILLAISIQIQRRALKKSEEALDIQKQELQETRDVLQDSATAQRQQVQYAEQSAKVAALTGLVNILAADIERIDSNTLSMVTQETFRKSAGAFTSKGVFLYMLEAQKHLAELANLRDEHMREIGVMKDQIRSIVDSHLKQAATGDAPSP